MKTIKKLILFIINFILFLNISYGNPFYSIDTLKVVIQINKDGSADISEKVKYLVYSAKEILYNIDYKNYGKLENLNIYYENFGNYQQGVKSNKKEKGNYTLNDFDGELEIKVYYPMEEENKTFSFNYSLTEAIILYEDVAQFTKKIVKENYGSDIKNIEIIIKLPEEVNQEEIYAFNHGLFSEKIDILNEKEIRFKLKNYKEKDFIEVNILFPKEIIFSSNSKIYKEEKGLKKIIDLEKKIANEASLKRKIISHKNIIGNIVFYFCIIWVIFIMSFVYLKNGKEYKIKEEEFEDISEKFSPAIVGSIITKDIKIMQLFATIMDLVRRGIFLIDVKDGKTILRLKECCDLKNLKDYEKIILKWYREELENNREVIIEDIEKTIRDKKNYIDYKTKYEEWKNLVELELKKVGFKIEEPKIIITTLGYLTGILSIPLGIIFLILFDSSKFIVFPFFISFILIIYTINIKRYSLEAEKLRMKCLTFKKFLIDYKDLEKYKLISDSRLEKYFIYVMAMGISEKVVENYNKILTLTDVDNRVSIIKIYNENIVFKNIEKEIYKNRNEKIRKILNIIKNKKNFKNKNNN